MNVQTMLFEKVDQDVKFLIKCLVEVLNDLGEHDLANLLDKKAEGHEIGNTLLDEKHIQVLSIYLQLLNLIEENASVQFRRKLKDEFGVAGVRGSWGEVFKRLKENGHSPEKTIEIVSQTNVCPVLTAHPTEAKRISILDLHREIYLKLVQLENGMFTKAERESIRDEIKGLLERWWRTGEVYLEKPTVKSERNNVLHYFRKVFPKILKHADQSFEQSWAGMGYDRELLKDPMNYPKVTFGSWVGGDRDGHPHVTADLTADTLMQHRITALEILIRMLNQLGAEMSFSEIRNEVPLKLIEEIKKKSVNLGDLGEKAVKRNSYEPWRQFINLMLLQLEFAASEDFDSEFAYQNAQEMGDDLRFLRESLYEIGAGRLASQMLFPIERQLLCFGFHLVKLDIRQNSAYHDKAIAQIIGDLVSDGNQFADWEEKKRLDWITEELKYQRPFAVAGRLFGHEADQVLAYFRAIKEHTDVFGTEGIGSFIISMTRKVSDMMVIYLFMREVGLDYQKFQVVPLFETIEDLKQSDSIMQDFLTHPFVKKLSIQRQEIMLGYSDSNKDGGIVSSRWNIYQTEKRLTEVANQHQIRFKFFHGIGGTISRGGGKYHRFLESMPEGSLSGEIKLTVQGETISQQFGNILNGSYNMEMLQAGTALQTSFYEANTVSNNFPIEALRLLSDLAKKQYQSLIRHDDFISFYGEATPIDILEMSKIGSRPARRTGTRTLDDLRAIPWVFSWSQSRFNLTGWFGIGFALEKIRNEHPDHFQSLKDNANKWPLLRYVLIQVETNLLSADPKWMDRYADLVKDSKVKNSIFPIIKDEYQRSLDELANMFDQDREVRRVGLRNSMKKRNQALDSLHELQVSYLTNWRKEKDVDTEKANVMLTRLLEITTALANGLKNTG